MLQAAATAAAAASSVLLQAAVAAASSVECLLAQVGGDLQEAAHKQRQLFASKPQSYLAEANM
jgi:hypothetical protein